MTERRTFTVTRPEDLAVLVADLVGKSGASDFELRWDAVDRTLAKGEETRPGERIKWEAIARYKRRGKMPARNIVGTATGLHEEATILGTKALLDLAERLGVNVILVDYTDQRDPREDSQP